MIMTLVLACHLLLIFQIQSFGFEHRRNCDNACGPGLYVSLGRRSRMFDTDINNTFGFMRLLCWLKCVFCLNIWELQMDTSLYMIVISSVQAFLWYQPFVKREIEWLWFERNRIYISTKLAKILFWKEAALEVANYCTKRQTDN